MPFQPILPTWVAWNNANFPTSSGVQDFRTGQNFPVGGLNIGDFFDATTQEAAQNSFPSGSNTLFSGRYRLVQVDSGATVANVKTGTIGYLRAGNQMVGVAITGAGSAQTNGTYNIAANVSSGGGSGAIAQVVISGGVITTATVLNPGQNYTSLPTFTVAAGGTPGTIVGQLNSVPNNVTSYDQQAAKVRPVVFLNAITPGNYGFVQELGVALVLGNGTIGTAGSGDWANATTGGTIVTTAASGGPVGATVGQCVDTALASNLFKVILRAPVLQD